jgi:hypothetical protein
MDEPRFEPQTDHSPNPLLSNQQPTDTPTSERSNSSYYPPGTPRSTQDLQTTRTQPPLTRSQVNVLPQILKICEYTDLMNYFVLQDISY